MHGVSLQAQAAMSEDMRSQLEGSQKSLAEAGAEMRAQMGHLKQAQEQVRVSDTTHGPAEWDPHNYMNTCRSLD